MVLLKRLVLGFPTKAVSSLVSGLAAVAAVTIKRFVRPLAFPFSSSFAFPSFFLLLFRLETSVAVLLLLVFPLLRSLLGSLASSCFTLGCVVVRGVGVIFTRLSPPNAVRVLREVGVLEFGELEVLVLLKTCMVVEFDHVLVVEPPGEFLCLTMSFSCRVGSFAYRW